MSLFDRSFEGPPSASDMEDAVRDLLWDGKLDAAHAVAEVMVDHWQHSLAAEGAGRFYYWLGIRASTGTLISAKKNRAERRRLGLDRRPAKRAPRKPADLPVSKERRHA